MALNIEEMIRQRQEDQNNFDRYMQAYRDQLAQGQISQEEYDRAKQYYLSPSEGYPLAQDRFSVPQVQPPIMYRPQDDFQQVTAPRAYNPPFARRDEPVPTAPNMPRPDMSAPNLPEPNLKFGGLLGPDGILANTIGDVAQKVAEKRGGTAVRVEDRPLNEPMRIVPGEGPPQERVQRMPSNLTLGQSRELARRLPNVAMQSDLGMVRASNEYDVMVSPELKQAMEKNNIRREDITEARKALSTNYGTMEHFKKLMSPEVAFGLALAFNNMRAFPNAQAGQYYAQQLQNIQNQKLSNQRMQNRSKWFEDRGRPDLADLVRTGGEEGFNEAMSMYTQKPAETFRVLTREEKIAKEIDPSLNVQENIATGQLSGFAGKAPTTNITVGGEGGFKKMGEQFATQDVELVAKAEKAVGRIDSLNNTSEAIIRGAVSEGQEGFETGPFAEIRKGFDQFLVGFGNRDPERVNRLSDAELIDATLGADVFGAIGEFGIGARGLDTPAEREFLRKVLTGTIETTPAALLYLAYIRQKLQRRVISRYNDYLAKGVYGPYAESRGMTAIESPSTIFGREFGNYKEMQNWLAEQKSKRQSESGEDGTVTKDGIRYKIKEVR